MEDYTPNSHKYKQDKAVTEERAKVEKVVTGNVKVKKKGELSKFADVFISEDAANVKSYILMDVLVPAVKKAISDIVRDGIDMILYGNSGRGKRGNADRVSYSSYSSDRRSSSGYGERRTTYNYDEVTFDSRGEAEKVLSCMDDIIETYRMVRVADFYDLVGVTGSHTDNKYGWTSLRTAEVVRVPGGGYRIKLPRALPID